MPLFKKETSQKSEIRNLEAFIIEQLAREDRYGQKVNLLPFSRSSFPKSMGKLRFLARCRPNFKITIGRDRVRLSLSELVVAVEDYSSAEILNASLVENTEGLKELKRLYHQAALHAVADPGAWQLPASIISRVLKLHRQQALEEALESPDALEFLVPSSTSRINGDHSGSGLLVLPRPLGSEDHAGFNFIILKDALVKDNKLEGDPTFFVVDAERFPLHALKGFAGFTTETTDFKLTISLLSMLTARKMAGFDGSDQVSFAEASARAVDEAARSLVALS